MVLQWVKAHLEFYRALICLAHKSWVAYIVSCFLVTHNYNDIDNNGTYTYANIKANSLVQIRTHLLTSDSSPSWSGPNFNCLPTPFKVNSQLPGWTPTSQHNGRTWTSIVCLHSPKSTPNSPFFKIFKFSGPSHPGMTSFTLQPHFLSEFYYDNCDCHFLCARA